MVDEQNDDIGSAPCSRSTVKEYLMQETRLDSLAASELCDKYEPIIANGILMGSLTYYVGDRIINAHKEAK